MSLLIVILLLVLFAMGMPIALAIGIVSLLYAMLVASVPLVIIPQQTLSAVDSFILLAVPMFLLSGMLMNDADVARRLVRFSRSLIGWMRGGLAHVNIMTNLLISGISGSGVADAAATGSALIPVMKKEGYSPAFAAAVTGCSSCAGPIIPPSIIMVIIGGLTTVSIARMFLGGFLPGILLGAVFGLLVMWIARVRKYPKTAGIDVREIGASFIGALPSLGLPLIIIGGILSGVFTPTESAAVAAAYVILLGLFYRQLTWHHFYRALVEVGVTTGTVMFVVGISGIFGWMLISEDIGTAIADKLLSITTNPTYMLLLIVGVLLVLGCIMEVIAILILTVPVLMPVVTQLGIDPVHFGVVATVALSTGLVTPPFGLTMFLMCRMANITIEQFAREAAPFIGGLIVVILLLVFFPQIVLYLPDLLMGQGR